MFVKAAYPTTCKNDRIVNSGMYIGYVKKLKHVLIKLIEIGEKDDEKDDQRLFNKICKNFNFTIDDKQLIFKNTSKNIIHDNDTSVFISFPGSGGTGIINKINRKLRGVYEHKHLFYPSIKSIILICLISFIFLLR
jgi:hypothetical protein